MVERGETKTGERRRVGGVRRSTPADRVLDAVKRTRNPSYFFTGRSFPFFCPSFSPFPVQVRDSLSDQHLRRREGTPEGKDETRNENRARVWESEWVNEWVRKRKGWNTRAKSDARVARFIYCERCNSAGTRPQIESCRCPRALLRIRYRVRNISVCATNAFSGRETPKLVSQGKTRRDEISVKKKCEVNNFIFAT